LRGWNTPQETRTFIRRCACRRAVEAGGAETIICSGEATSSIHVWHRGHRALAGRSGRRVGASPDDGGARPSRPDGCGHAVFGAAGLGHTRLAIIDPAHGHQPMASDDGRVAVTYNGELYNFRELRAELERAGHRFRTTSDTEVVLHAWIEWQERCVERFRGMFAFAIVDRDRELVFLARDHFGIKPLVYFSTASGCASRPSCRRCAARPAFPRRWTCSRSIATSRSPTFRRRSPRLQA
jgi:hypothetical protein